MIRDARVVRCAVCVCALALALGACRDKGKTPAPEWTSVMVSSPLPEAAALVARVTPEADGLVLFRVDPALKTAVLSESGGKLLIAAPNTAEAVRGYGYYLRHLAGVHLSWNGDHGSCVASGAMVNLPKTPVTVPATLPYNYALNYCTLSYTGVHWDKERWGKEIDRLALNGYRYMLVTPGLEKVTAEFLKELGCPPEKIRAYIANPAFGAWWNMGNLEGAGGPVSDTLIESEAELGRFMVERLKSLGMEPVLQGYVGFLPHDFAPEGGRVLPQGNWCGHFVRPSVLDPTCEAFPRVAALWYNKLKSVYGVQAEAFGGDLFHEGGKSQGVDVTAAARAVQSAMPGKSLWLVQAWGHNPTKELLAGLDSKRTLILALEKNMAAKSPQKNYNGLPYVWCELLNFGGNHGLYGGVPMVAGLPADMGGASGFGLLSEGVETNPFYYELFHDRMNSGGPIDTEAFIKRYVKSRYGKESPQAEEAFRLLTRSVYAPKSIREGCLESILCARPSLDARKASTWSDPNMYYDPKDVEEALRKLLAAGPMEAETYRYDLTDLCRQVIADRARVRLAACKAAFAAKDVAAFTKEYQAFLALIKDSAEVLATSKDFLLGEFLRGAANRGTTPQDKAAMTRAVKRLVTTWAPVIGQLDDYAHRQFSELMSHYYYHRWEAFFQSRLRELGGTASADELGRAGEGTTTNNGEAVATGYEKNKNVDEIELAFPDSDIPLRLTPQGDIHTIAKRILGE
ncbi:MAG: alpha-N-acetylglucosaminidase [Akkermansia muciniphila]|nr:alpha-N-acetylglucosaminidase [Akkermansia muciniphila]